MPIIKSQDISLYYETYWIWQPLILISWIWYTLWQWNRMIPFLSKYFKVIVFDNRWVGRSDKPIWPYSAKMLADDTVWLLDWLGIDKAIVLWHSMGWFIAQEIAIWYPDRLEKLVLCSTHFGWINHVPIPENTMKILNDTSIDSFERFVNWLKVSTAPGWIENNPEVLEEWINRRKKCPIDTSSYNSQLSIGLSLFSEDNSFEWKLHNINIKTLIVSWDSDNIVPKENAYLLWDKIKNSEVIVLPDVWHFVPLESPKIFSEEIVKFCL